MRAAGLKAPNGREKQATQRPQAGLLPTPAAPSCPTLGAGLQLRGTLKQQQPAPPPEGLVPCCSPGRALKPPVLIQVS